MAAATLRTNKQHEINSWVAFFKNIKTIILSYILTDHKSHKFRGLFFITIFISEHYDNKLLKILKFSIYKNQIYVYFQKKEIKLIW